MNSVVEMLGVENLTRMTKRQVNSIFVPISPTPTDRQKYCSQILYQVLNFGIIVSSALMIWKGLIVLTRSESPIVVVLRFV